MTSPEQLGKNAPTPRGRTNWRRFTVALSGGLLGAIVLFWLTATGALAVSITLPSNVPYSVSAKHLSGTGMVMHPAVIDGHNVMELSIGHAEIQSIDQTICAGHTGVRIHAGDGTPVEATGLILDTTTLNAGSANFGGGVSIGLVNGQIGMQSEGAQPFTIDGLDQHNAVLFTKGASMTLPGLSMSLVSC